MTASQWFLYMIECSDGRLYTGITTDIERRFDEHQNNHVKGAKPFVGKGLCDWFSAVNGQSIPGQHSGIGDKKITKIGKKCLGGCRSVRSVPAGLASSLW